MFGQYSYFPRVLTGLFTALLLAGLTVLPSHAYRVCTFKGTVVDNGWRSMTVKSNGQCAEVNVGWRTKYIPNRRPCLGELVAVDFILEDGYIKATKVVSLSPVPQSAQCYPPPPPSGSECRTVGDEAAPSPDRDSCTPSRPICSTKPPAHVSDPSWSPDKQPSASKPESKPGLKKTAPEKKEKPSTSVAPSTKETKDESKEPAAATDDKKGKSLTGEVVASSPKSLSLRVMEDGENAEVINVKVGLKTKFIPFRRPAVGEKVKVEYRQENGEKFGYTVQVVQ